jgi:hypothetical protein
MPVAAVHLRALPAAYVSIRQHTSAYVSRREFMPVAAVHLRALPAAAASSRMSHVRACLNKEDMRERRSWRGKEADLSSVCVCV